jgi:hypothetical protein
MYLMPTPRDQKKLSPWSHNQISACNGHAAAASSRLRQHSVHLYDIRFSKFMIQAGA